MLPPDLAPEKNVETNDPAELRNLLENEFRISHVPASLRDLAIRPDGRVEVGGAVFSYTQSFLEDVAKAIGMPVGYAYEIDFNLFQINFEIRKQVKDSAVQLSVLEERVVGIAPSEYRPARTFDVLDALPLAGCWRIQKASLSDRSVEVDFLSDRLTLEPRPGDEIRAGIRISNSETGGPGLKAALFTHRLICSNGAVMADELGTIRWNYDKRVTYRASVRKFTNDLERLRDREARLSPVYAAAVSHPLLEEDFVRLWRRLRTGLTVETADRVLGVDAEERRELQAAVAERADAGLPSRASTWTVYEMHNRVTGAAKSFPLGTRSRLERLGGALLASVN